jgi:DNA primase
VGYEGRLDAEIRILRLPADQDPDDLIRQDTELWADLLEETLPVVDFYLDILMEDTDLEDTKAKAHIVDKLLPVLKAVANPVERQDYVQKIARTLRLDERAVLARLRSAGRQKKKRRHQDDTRQKAKPSKEAPNPNTRLESHCLAMLLQRPSLLPKTNQALRERDLPPLRPEDFEEAGLRAILDAWQTVLDTNPSVSIDLLREALPADLHTKLEKVSATQDPNDIQLADEQMVRDIVLTLLRLRQRRLKRIVQDLKMLRLEAQEDGDARTKQYDQPLLTHTKVLLRTQQALAQSW